MDDKTTLIVFGTIFIIISTLVLVPNKINTIITVVFLIIILSHTIKSMSLAIKTKQDKDYKQKLSKYENKLKKNRLKKYVTKQGFVKWGTDEQINDWSEYELKSTIRQLQRKIIKKDIEIKNERYFDAKRKAEKIVRKEFTKEKIKQRSIRSEIIKFLPSQPWSGEEGYHGELQGYLKRKFPESEVEIQRGSSRPDIVVDDTAIEVKGPTTNEGLITIADKSMRYTQHFKKFIVVLFNVKVKKRMYKEWKKGMENTFPHVDIIRIDDHAKMGI